MKNSHDESTAAREISRPKILAIASRGGHWIQLLRLRDAFQGCDVVFATTVPEYRAMVAGQSFRLVTEANRDRKLRLIVLMCQLLWILLRERPDTVITTGAAPGYLAVRLARWLGIRTLWVDSIANAEELSLSGRLAAKHADAVLTQWEHLALPGRVEYRGAVI